MANRKRSSKNSSILVISILSVLVILGILLLTTNISFFFKKSIHDDASKYQTRHCLVFYPDNADSKKIAKTMCSGVKEDTIYDYSLVPFGDYYLVSYPEGTRYFVDKEYNWITVNEVSDFGKRIIADYLRYSVKKRNPDDYYNISFLEETQVENIDFSNVTYTFDNEYLVCHFDKYDIDVQVPLKYMQSEIGMNFGYQNELYVKPTYIDPNHPVICLTFDDGPQLWYEPSESSSPAIIDVLHKYDVTGTFYVVGESLEERDAWTDYQVYSFIKESINNGNEYGSHTQYHDALDELSSSEVYKTINEPAEFIYDLVGYKMKTYRPPYGYINDSVMDAQPFAAIMWNVDSLDWDLLDSEKIYDEVMKYELLDGDIILFHEIYDTTTEALEKIIPALISEGYQMVTVSEMLKYEGIDVSNLTYYYNLKPWPYYE